MTSRSRKLRSHGNMIGGSREYLTDRTFHVRTESGRMANAARKTAFTVFLALCIGLVVTLGILLGFFAKRSPLNCESGSSARGMSNLVSFFIQFKRNCGFSR